MENMKTADALAAQLLSRIAALESEIVEARKDSARIDKLSDMARERGSNPEDALSISMLEEVWLVGLSFGDTLREAIDRA